MQLLDRDGARRKSSCSTPSARSLDGLEVAPAHARDWVVTRAPTDSDRRVLRVSLTAKGRALREPLESIGGRSSR